MADLKSKFLQVYSVLKSELLEDPAFEFTNDSRQWVERVPSSFFTFSFNAMLLVYFQFELDNDELLPLFMKTREDLAQKQYTSTGNNGVASNTYIRQIVLISFLRKCYIK